MWGHPSCPEHSHATRWTFYPWHKAEQTHHYMEVLETGSCPKVAGLNGVCPHDGALVEESPMAFKVKLSSVAWAAYSLPKPSADTRAWLLDCPTHPPWRSRTHLDSLWILFNRSLVSSLELGIDGTSFPFVFMALNLLQLAQLASLGRKQLTLGFRLVASYRDASTGEPVWKGPESPWYSGSCPNWSSG